MNKFKAVIFDVGGVLLLPKDKEKRKGKNLLNSYKALCLLLNFPEINLKKFGEETVEIYKKASIGNLTKEEALKLMSKKGEVSPKNLEKFFKKTYLENIIENKN